MVVNYFNPMGNSRLEATVCLCLECLLEYTEPPYEIILVDSSGREAKKVSSLCLEHGIARVDCPADTGFAAAYNRGLRLSSGAYLATLASDIFVSSGWNRTMLSELRRTGAWIAIPYLSESDQLSQCRWYVFRRRAFVPIGMTFNLNVIARDAYRRLGDIDESLSGTFNDLDYLVRARRAGGEVVQVEAGNIVHIGRATVAVRSSVDYERDRKSFAAKYPDVVVGGRKPAEVLCRSPLLRTVYYLSSFLPARLRFAVVDIVRRCEPLVLRV
ncbi:MAG: glycosyltransferase family 2 protein [Anaerolineae bacterium]